MKLHVLGSNSKGNGYILEGKSQTLLLECGLPLKDVKEALNFDLTKVVGVLCSHSHGDHAKWALQYAAAGIGLYTSNDTYSHLTAVKPLEKYLIEVGKQYTIGEFKVIPFSVKHDVPCLGFLINHPESGNILFVTDTHYIPNTFKGLNQILIEANYEERILNENLIDGKIDNMRYQRVIRSHMSLETCVEALKKNDLKGVQNIVLIHLSPQNSDASLFKSKVVEATGKNVHIALKGLVIDFNKEPF